MKIYNFEQRSPDWYDVRMGVITASQIKRVMGLRNSDETYLNELLSQRITKQFKELYVSDSMEHGIHFESDACEVYSYITNNKLDHVGFILKNEYVGCSPDGLIGNLGLLEIKCPNTSTHLGYIRNDVVPKDYLFQCLYQLYVTDREWVDFMSYDPRISNPHNVFIKRVDKESYADEYKKLQEKLDLFIQKYKKAISLFEDKR